MTTKSIIGITAAVVSLTGLSIYVKKKVDLISNDLDYSFSKDSVVVRKLTPNQVSLTLDLIIKNQGNLDLQARDLRMKILSDRKVLTNINKYGDFSVKPNGLSRAKVEINFSPKEIIASGKESGINLTNWRLVPITFAGTLKVKQLGIYLPIPFRVTYTLSDFL